MTSRNLIFTAWLASGFLAIACWVASSAVGSGLWVVPGLVFLTWGLAVVANWRGAADAMPTTSGIGPFRTTVTRPTIRLIFAGFALWGAVVLVLGIVALAR